MKKIISIIIEFIKNLFGDEDMQKPRSVISSSPLGRTPYNSRLAITTEQLSVNPIQTGTSLAESTFAHDGSYLEIR